MTPIADSAGEFGGDPDAEGATAPESLRQKDRFLSLAMLWKESLDGPPKG
jgi:hypothetical protein